VAWPTFIVCVYRRRRTEGPGRKETTRSLGRLEGQSVGFSAKRGGAHSQLRSQLARVGVLLSPSVHRLLAKLLRSGLGPFVILGIKGAHARVCGVWPAALGRAAPRAGHLGPRRVNNVVLSRATTVNHGVKKGRALAGIDHMNDEARGADSAAQPSPAPIAANGGDSGHR
jgi:hypothetical protein